MLPVARTLARMVKEMSGQDKKPKSGVEIAFGLGLSALGLYIWPEAGGSAQEYLFGGTSTFMGAITALKGLQTFKHGRKIKQDRKAAQITSNTYGDARFATVEELEAAGMTKAGGLFLGMLNGVPLFFDGKAHVLTIAAARKGKGICAVIPNLLHYTGSVFVTDPKGELAAVTAKHREERFGHKVYVLNPWGLHGLPQHRFNPLQVLIDAYADEHLRRGMVEEAAALALQLLPEPPDGKNRYFRDGSRRLLVALMLHLATWQGGKRCTLPELWRILQSRRRMDTVVVDMAGNTALNGVVQDFADDLVEKLSSGSDQFGDFREGALQAVSIFDPNGFIGECVSGSDFSFADLKRGKVSVYQVIPPDRVATHGVWLGLSTKQAIDAVGRTQGNGRVLFMLDEFANLGKLEGLAEALTTLPGLGVRVWMFVQEPADLKRVYGAETAQTIFSQWEVKQVFGVQGQKLAEELSKQLGKRTVKTRNYNLGKTDTDDVGETLGETGKDLMTADEILRMPSGKQLLFISGQRPVMADKVPYWLGDPWAEWAETNPVEGNAPHAEPVLKLAYKKKGGTDE